MSNVFGRGTHSFLFLLGLLLFTLPALCQQVIGVSAILPSTNSSIIYTYSATELDYSTNLYYDAAVYGYLFQNSTLIRSGSATSGTTPLADGYMNAPVVVGANYQLESDHYLTAFYIVYIEDIPYYSNPHYYLISTGGGSGGSSSNFSSGGGDPYISSQTIFLGTTVIGISTAAPYIGGIVDWASGTTSGVRGTTGYIEVYGSNLLDVFTGGTTPHISGTGVFLYVDYASPMQVNLGYTINSSASTGNRALTLSTRFGTSNGKTFTIADPTPKITSISPNPWTAGSVLNFTINGTGFGSNPSMSVSGSGAQSASVITGSDTQITAIVDLQYATSGTANVVVTTNGFGGNSFTPMPGGGSQNQGMSYVAVNSFTVTQSPTSFNLSTGDTSKTITTSVSGTSMTFTPVFAWGLLSNPNSSCNANVGFSSNSGTGSVNTTVTASSAGCSGIFSAQATVAPRTSNVSTQIIVPPQILIKFLVGEAGGQVGTEDMSQLAIASSAKNRFGDSAFPGGIASTYQGVLIPGQYYGASNGTAHGREPELANAVSIFTGTTGDIVGGSKCYWSPTATQWATVQSALSSGTTVFPANTGAPDCWSSQPRQIVYKSSVALNNVGGLYSGAPAFLFLRPTTAGSPVVVQIP